MCSKCGIMYLHIRKAHGQARELTTQPSSHVAGLVKDGNTEYRIILHILHTRSWKLSSSSVDPPKLPISIGGGS